MVSTIQPQTQESPNKVFALNLYHIHASLVEDNQVEYTIESQVVFFTGPTDEYARHVYSEFLDPGWQIGAIVEVPPIEKQQKLGDGERVYL
ncbi:hypothetical protein ANRL1_02875 [Anaerolineae bacterium]|nr:hypothetical protein ANRL1_02875 [Anaerolineae bacterium]